MRAREDVTGVDVVFTYLNMPDAWCHRLFSRPEMIKHHYVELDIFAEKLRSVVEPEKFIIVSDHGFDLRRETHSRYGFFSCNIPLHPKPNKITDFHKIVVNSISHVLPLSQRKED